MNTTHTPGPWQWTSVAGGWDGVIGPSGLAICKLVENNPENARLIAAAPEMFDELRLVRGYLDAVRENMAHIGEYAAVNAKIEHLDALIAKATGGAS